MVTVSQIRWINENMSIMDFLEELGVEVGANGKCFCPFHYNVNTPAAKVYTSKEDIGTLYCYSERRSYTAFDVIRQCGYSDAAIRNMVPREHWYLGKDSVKQESNKVPVVNMNVLRTVSRGAFQLLAKLDQIWEHPGDYKQKAI